MKKLFLLIITSIFLLISVNIYAIDISKDTKLYVSGESIGIRLNTNVMVMGMYGIREDNNIYTPWKDSNISEGDYIVKYNGCDITSKSSLFEAINNSKGNLSSITLKRNDKLIDTYIKPCEVNDKYHLGLYIKDYVLGVGTLTYILPEYNIYGSLGHQMIDTNSYGGEIYKASVDKIIKPRGNEAGEKRATISSDMAGNVSKNTLTGIHGNVIDSYDKSNLKLLNIKLQDEVQCGSAQIMTSISSTEVGLYDINITELKKQKNKDIKGIKFKVTDETLISKCGGIVQGMSGSPIIQDNKIVGAVTHVMLKNPLEAYGIYIEFMLNDMDIYIVD
ncbi:MAG: SpoIVB peptidase S55 domain-containing protein [Anaeroplasmataceae bacterium]